MGLKIRKKKPNTLIVEDYTPIHRFPGQWLIEAQVEGLVELGAGKLTLKATNGDFVWDLIRYPGAYCAYCDHRFGNGPAVTKAEADERLVHVAECPKNDGSAKEPSGVLVANYHEGRARGRG